MAKAIKKEEDFKKVFTCRFDKLVRNPYVKDAIKDLSDLSGDNAKAENTLCEVICLSLNIIPKDDFNPSNLSKIIAAGIVEILMKDHSKE